jgi:hypothetical protein
MGATVTSDTRLWHLGILFFLPFLLTQGISPQTEAFDVQAALLGAGFLVLLASGSSPAIDELSKKREAQ